MKLTCAQCKKPARKFYRIASDEGDLVCRRCLLKNNKAGCDNCDKVTILYVVWDDGGPDGRVLCRDCFLSEARADFFDVEVYREALLEEAAA